MAAGSVIVTVSPYTDFKMTLYSILWTSDGSGNVNGHQSDLSVIKAGYLRQMKFMPTGGPQPPTDLYDVTLTDGTYDYLQGLGANRSATVANMVLTTSAFFYDNEMFDVDLVVTNAGATAFGTVKLWVAQ